MSVQPSPLDAADVPVDPFRISSHEELRAIIADAKATTKAKVVDRLGRLEREFIARAPLLFVATASADGSVTVSPKGDGPGVVSIADERTLLIPERPGNGLAYGLSNMIDNPHIGIIFVIPGSTETFRVDGKVELTRDPELLGKLAARGKDALLVVRVHIERCFFHCSKAFLRSDFWKADTWPAPFALSWGEWAKQWFDVPDVAAKQIDADIEKDEAENL
jgi:PPOX class probable FMN-dependent enzyme